jgi:hypothetical protein
MLPQWAKLAAIGSAMIYLGNLLINRAVDELDREQIRKRIDREVWDDATRMPEPVPAPARQKASHRRRKVVNPEPVPDDREETADADSADER